MDSVRHALCIVVLILGAGIVLPLPLGIVVGRLLRKRT